MNRLNFHNLVNFPDTLTANLPEIIDGLSHEDMARVVRNAYFTIYLYADITSQLTELILSKGEWQTSKVFPSGFRPLARISSKDREEMFKAIKRMGNLDQINDVPLYVYLKFLEASDEEN